MQQISSDATPFTKFFLPGAFLAMWPIWLITAVNDPKMIGGVAFGAVACAFLLWWTLPIKKVSIAHGHFVISNYFREIEVPVTHLARIKEDRWNRTPNITLFFDPPTALGRKIRIIPPFETFSRKEFDRVARLLADLCNKEGAVAALK